MDGQVGVVWCGVVWLFRGASLSTTALIYICVLEGLNEGGGKGFCL